MLKWQENFLAGESVKDPEKIKKKLNSGKPVLGIYLLTLSEKGDKCPEPVFRCSGHLSPYSVRESCESDGYYSCSNADTEELLWNLSEDHRNGEGQRGSPGDGAKSDR